MASPEDSSDCACDLARFDSLTRAIDAGRVAAAASAFTTIRDHDLPPRALTWSGALVALEAFADALADLEQCQVDYDRVTLLVPHVALAGLAPGVAKRERVLDVRDFNRIVSS